MNTAKFYKNLCNLSVDRKYKSIKNISKDYLFLIKFIYNKLVKIKSPIIDCLSK